MDGPVKNQLKVWMTQRRFIDLAIPSPERSCMTHIFSRNDIEHSTDTLFGGQKSLQFRSSRIGKSLPDVRQH